VRFKREALRFTVMLTIALFVFLFHATMSALSTLILYALYKMSLVEGNCFPTFTSRSGVITRTPASSNCYVTTYEIQSNRFTSLTWDNITVDGQMPHCLKDRLDVYVG